MGTELLLVLLLTPFFTCIMETWPDIL